MSVLRPGRRTGWLFLVGAGGLIAALTQTIGDLPRFGSTPHPYGARAVATAVGQQAANAIGSVTFDQRGLDTMGEEFILFAAAVGSVLLLRRLRREEEDSGKKHGYGPEDVFEVIRLVGYAMLPITILVGAYIVIHGHTSPGGGFQGGIVLASGLHLAYLTGDFRTLDRLRPIRLFDVSEAVAATAFVAVGVAGLVSAGAFLANVLPHGSLGGLLSAGTVPILNVVVGIEVASASTLLVAKFLEQALLMRKYGGGD